MLRLRQYTFVLCFPRKRFENITFQKLTICQSKAYAKDSTNISIQQQTGLVDRALNGVGYACFDLRPSAVNTRHWPTDNETMI